MTVEAQAAMMERLMGKIQNNNRDDIIRYEEFMIEDADYIIVTYGVSARTGRAAVEEARAQGIKVGMLRLITVWPFAEEKIRDLANQGQRHGHGGNQPGAGAPGSGALRGRPRSRANWWATPAAR